MEIFESAKSHLRAVRNYQPGKPIEEVEREYGVKNALKMASNENALGPSPKAVAAVRKNLAKIHRYPDGGCFYLRQKLSKALAMKPEELVFGNGSDEILVLAVRAFAGEGDEIIIADPTFLIYEIAGQVENARVVKVPMIHFRYDLDGMKKHVSESTKLIFIANPDNPIGTYVSEKGLREFLTGIPANIPVVLDEAYYEFAREKKDYPDSLSMLEEFPNLIVTRTFSKAYGLGGLRIGYGIASEKIANAMNKVREPFNVNSLAQAAALGALDDKLFVKKTVGMVREGKKYLEAEFKKMGLTTVETATNFVLFDLGSDSRPVYEALLRKGVIVRPMAAWGLPSFIRVTIGRKAENQRFIQALKQILKK